jgi:hypothetical protein
MVVSPADLDPRMTALVRPNSNYKLQTRPLVREDTPHQLELSPALALIVGIDLKNNSCASFG